MPERLDGLDVLAARIAEELHEHHRVDVSMRLHQPSGHFINGGSIIHSLLNRNGERSLGFSTRVVVQARSAMSIGPADPCRRERTSRHS
jgi:hypothetical protein